MRHELGDVLAELRAQPRHLALGGLVSGALLAPLGPPAVLGAAGVAAALGGRAGPALVGAGTTLAGAELARLRAAAGRRTVLRPSLGHVLAVRVVVLEPPRAGRFDRAALARIVRGPGAGERIVVSAGRRLAWPRDPVGAELRAVGALRRLRPGQAFQRRRGAHADLRADALRATGVRRGGAAGLVDDVRRRSVAVLAAAMPRPEGALARGMVLGDDAALPEAVRDDFRAAGLSHIVAASGQNVLLLAALAIPVLAGLGLGLRARLVALLALIALYVPLAGGGPSIQRAGVMGAAAVLAALAGRPASRWYALGLAAAVTLAWSPAAAGDPGWQLSFAAVASIFLLAPGASRWLRERGWPRAAADGGALAVAATIGTGPLLAFHFGRVSLVSLPVNLIAAPVVAVVMWIGMIGAAVGQAVPALGRDVARTAAPALAFLLWLARVAARLPHATAELGEGSLPLMLGAYAGLATAVAARRARRPMAALATAGLAVVIAWPDPASSLPPGAARISFLDVGQGDATLVQIGSRAILVDAGPRDGPILERLEEAGVRRLDLAVVTHDQDDHEGGMASVLRRHAVGLLLDGAAGAITPGHRALVAATAGRHVRRVAPDAGQELDVGRVRVRVLWPPAEPAADHAGEDPNLRAIVARVSVGTFDLLLPADAESDVTSALALGPVEALKVAHHGSADPGLPTELERLRPGIAVLEVGRNNTYGHPTPQALAALRAVPRLYRTDRDGTVTLTVRGDRAQVETSRRR